MKILNERPPIYEAIVQHGMHPHEGVIYTYGDTIYNPSGRPITDYTIIHEETHCKQQGTDPDAWWGRYLIDQYFRLEQEAEACGRQYAFICRTVKDRNERNRILMERAQSLAGPVYGNMIGTYAAYTMIKKKSGVYP